MKKAVFLLLGVALLAAAPGCRHPRRGENIVGPFQPQNAKIERGSVVFAQHCHQCHPGGGGGLGPGINDKPLPKFLMKTQVRAGLGVMPGFSEEQISSEDLDALVDYMVALRRHDDPLPGRLSLTNRK